MFFTFPELYMLSMLSLFFLLAELAEAEAARLVLPERL